MNELSIINYPLTKKAVVLIFYRFFFAVAAFLAV